MNVAKQNLKFPQQKQTNIRRFARVFMIDALTLIGLQTELLLYNEY